MVIVKFRICGFFIRMIFGMLYEVMLKLKEILMVVFLELSNLFELLYSFILIVYFFGLVGFYL